MALTFGGLRAFICNFLGLAYAIVPWVICLGADP